MAIRSGITKKSKQVKTPENEEVKKEKFYAIQMNVSIPEVEFWLPVTSQKTGHKVFLPLPIRLITQLPDEKGGGCIVRGAYGDESTAKENICEILRVLNGVPIGKGASCWEITS